MNTTKKHHFQGDTPMKNIGTLIVKRVKEKGLSYAEVCRRIGIKDSVFQGYIYQSSVQTAILWKLSIALEHNFFADLMEDFPEKVLSSNLSTFQTTIKNQEEEIKNLKKEIEIYKEILSKRV